MRSIPKGQRKAEELILGTDPHRGRDFYDKPDGELLHLTNWIESRPESATPPLPGRGEASARPRAAHLGNRAYRSGQLANWTSA